MICSWGEISLRMCMKDRIKVMSLKATNWDVELRLLRPLTQHFLSIKHILARNLGTSLKWHLLYPSLSPSLSLSLSLSLFLPLSPFQFFHYDNSTDGGTARLSTFELRWSVFAKRRPRPPPNRRAKKRTPKKNGDGERFRFHPTLK